MTRRLLTISFSLFLVSAMMGAFLIPGTNSVSIPSTATLKAPSSSSAISVATDTAAVAGAGTTATPSDTSNATNMTEPINPSPLESIEVFRSENLDLNSEDPLLLPKTASSGHYRASVSPLSFKQPGGMPPQKRAASTESQQQQQQQQNWSPSQAHGQQWYPPQGQGQQWYPPQNQGQQWYPSQGQQWYPPQGQQGQQWYLQGQDRGQQIGKRYTVQKRDIVSTSTNNAATAAPQGGSPPLYRMSALVCSQDTRAPGLIHCSDNRDYYTVEQPPNPANSADPRNRPWSSSSPAGQAANGASPVTAALRKRAVATQGINIPAAPPGSVSALGTDPQGWLRRPQPYGPQPQGQRSQISKRQVGTRAAVAAAADMSNQAAAASIAASSVSATSAAAAANQAKAIAAATHRQQGGSASTENVDLSDLSKWSGPGYNGGTGGDSNWGGKSRSSGYGKWKRVDHDEGNLSKWSDSGYGSSGSGGGSDDWSHWGQGGGKGGKKWSKRQAPGAYGRGGNTAAIPVPIDIGLVWDGSKVNLVPPPSSHSAGPSGPGGPAPGVGGIPAGSIVVGADAPAIPVPINVDALVYPDGQMRIFPLDSRN